MSRTPEKPLTMRRAIIDVLGDAKWVVLPPLIGVLVLLAVCAAIFFGGGWLLFSDAPLVLRLVAAGAVVTVALACWLLAEAHRRVEDAAERAAWRAGRKDRPC